ncbi:hypothetical protein [Streptomyces erythrochromogenes]|uniref:hypothetical protein n=1 Tax=Streptomyces erythrochromogenes TaxID=285574 RepID=UPI0037D291DC
MTERDAALAAAVRAGDTARVRDLLGAGADPGAVGEDGLPVLCAAVAAFASGVAEALVAAGSDRDQRLPDGTTPLLRAIEAACATARGADRSPEIAEALARLLDAEDQDVRLSGAYGLALRDDPRTVEAYARVGRLDRPEYEHDHRPDGLWRWKLRNAPSG